MNSDDNQISYSNEEDFGLRRGPWTLEEDNLLTHYIACHGQGSWNSLAKSAGLKRTGKSCRLRWLNYLKPDVKRGNLTPEEQLTILELHSRWGNRWSKIAQHLPGRTDNEIKNYWRTRVQKQARQLKVDANSKTFLEAVRCFWMPRLLEKMEQQQSSSTSTSSSSSSISTKQKQDSTIGSLQNNHSILAQSSSPEHRKLKETSITQNGNSLPSNFSSTCEYHNGNSNTIHDSRYDSRFENLGYNTEWYSQQAMLMSATGSEDLLLSEYLMPEVDLFNDELGCGFWNTDELWKAT